MLVATGAIMKALYLAVALGATATAIDIVVRGTQPPVAALVCVGLLALVGFSHGLVLGLGRTSDRRHGGGTPS